MASSDPHTGALAVHSAAERPVISRGGTSPWEAFSASQGTGNTPATYRIEPLLTEPQLDQLLRRAHHTQRPCRMRVYDTHGRRDDLARRFFAEPWHTGSAHNRLRELAGGPVAFMLNHMQDHDDDLGQRVATLMQGFYATRGLPPNGVDLVLFAGDYAATPFGAHQGFEHAFLAHCGPATKHFHTWSSEAFEALTGSTGDVHAWEHLRPHSTCFTLKPGTLLYLPAHVFHIAEQQGFGFSIAICLNQQSPRQVARSYVAHAHAAEAPLPYLSADHGIAQLHTALAASLRELEDGLEDFAERIVLQRASNGGLVQHQALPARPVHIDADAAFQARPPYRMFLRRHDTHARIYARHRLITLRWHDALPRALAQLNDASITLPQLVAMLAPWSHDRVLGWLHALVAIGAVEVS